MHIIERVLIVLTLLGSFLALSKVNGGIFLTTIAGLTLAFFYFAFGFWVLNNFKFKQLFQKAAYSEVGALNLVWGQAAGMFIYSVAVIGIIFKTTFKPGGDLFLTVGLASIAVELVIAGIAMAVKGGSIPRDHLIRAVFYGLVSIAFYYLVEPNALPAMH